MLQVVLGAEKRKEQQAPLRRVAAVQENCERPAEVRHGERQVWQGVGHFSCTSKEEESLGRQQSASASYTRSLRSLA